MKVHVPYIGTYRNVFSRRKGSFFDKIRERNREKIQTESKNPPEEGNGNCNEANAVSFFSESVLFVALYAKTSYRTAGSLIRLWEK